MPNQTKNIYTLRNYILVQSQLYFTCTKFPWSLFTKLHYAEYEHKSVQGYNVCEKSLWMDKWMDMAHVKIPPPLRTSGE